MKHFNSALVGAIICAALSPFFFANTAAADRVGNNGKLAIQQISDENPGLDEFDVLMRAFENGTLPTPEQFVPAAPLSESEKLTRGSSTNATCAPARLWHGITYDAYGVASPIELFTGGTSRGPVFPFQYLAQMGFSGVTDISGHRFLTSTPNQTFHKGADGRTLVQGNIEIRSYYDALISIRRNKPECRYSRNGICDVGYFYETQK